MKEAHLLSHSLTSNIVARIVMIFQWLILFKIPINFLISKIQAHCLKALYLAHLSLYFQMVGSIKLMLESICKKQTKKNTFIYL